MKINKTLQISLVIGLLYISPFVLGGFLYKDDLTRTPSTYGWDHNARYLSTIISKIIGNGEVLNINPLSTFLSAIVLVAIGSLLSTKLEVKSSTVFNVIFSLILLTSPFYLDNMSYQYDVLPMSLSVAFACLSFLLVQRYKSLVHVAASSSLLLMAICTYQSSLNIYISGVILFFIKGVYDSLTFKSLVRYCIISIIVLIISYSFYSFVIFDVSDLSTYSAVSAEIDGDILGNICDKTINYIEIYKSLFHGHIGKIFFLIYASPIVILLINAVINKKLFTSFIIASLYLSVFAFSFASLLVLKTPPYFSRAMISSSLVLVCSFYILYKECNNGIVLKSISLAYIFSAFTLCSALYMIQKLANEYYDIRISTLNALINIENPTGKIYVHDNTLTPGVKYFTQSFPFLKKLEPLYFKNEQVYVYALNKINYSVLPCNKECAREFTKNSEHIKGKSIDRYIKNESILYYFK